MLSIDITKLADTIINRYGGKKSTVAKYVEAVADEADELSKIWTNIASAIILGEKITPQKVRRIVGPDWLNTNGRQYHAIEQFYLGVSTSIGSKSNQNWVDSIVNSLGTIIYSRKNAKEALSDFAENTGSLLLLTELEDHSNTDKFASSLAAIQKEAANLRVLAKHIAAISK